MVDTLPDSRLQNRKDFGTMLIEWPGVRPTGVHKGEPWGRIECVPVFCANCGVHHGYVPRENTTFLFWLCDPCFEKHGAIAGTYFEPDQVFWEKIINELLNHFGHHPTPLELKQLEEEGWGPLASLLKESPYKIYK